MSTGARTNSHAATLLATGLGLFMIFLDATIVNVALPDIQSEFHVGESGIQWVVAAYSLTMGMFMMSAATLSDATGRRRTYVLGIVIFSIASIGCAAAPTLLVLNLSRALEGVGAGVVNVASLALVSASYPDARMKARAIGVWTGIAAVGLAIGPTLGGILTEQLGWRSIFVINPLVGVVAIILTYAFVAESRDPTPHRFDGAGQILFIVFVGALTYALVEGPHTGWASPEIIGLLIGSAVLLGLFIVAELRSPDPMMDVRLFRDRVYSAAIGTVFAVLFTIYGTMLIVTQYFQNVQSYSPERAGFLMLAMTIPTIILSPIAGRLAGRLGARRPTLAGVSLVVIGSAILALTMGGWLGYTLLGLAFVGGAGGLAVAPATNEAMSSVPGDRAGMGSGILSAQRALGSTAGFAIMGSVLAIVVAATLPGKLAPFIPDQTARDAISNQIAESADPHALAALIGPGHPLPEEIASVSGLEQATDDAFVQGMQVAMAVGFAVVLLAFITGWIVFPRRVRRDEQDEATDAAVVSADEISGPRGILPAET